MSSSEKLNTLLKNYLATDSNIKAASVIDSEGLVIASSITDESDEAIVISSGLLSQTISIEVIIKSEPLQLQWPDDLAGLVPQPEQCEIESILPVSTGNYLITCTPADENALPIYLNSLADSGFVETNRMVGMDDEILSVTLHTDSANVQLMNSTMNANLMINVELN